MHCVDLGERRIMKMYYLVATFGFDTAVNEPCKVCPLSAYRSPRCSPRGERESSREMGEQPKRGRVWATPTNAELAESHRGHLLQ